jgi:hypothetical protein
MRTQAVVDFFKAREAASTPAVPPKTKKRVKKSKTPLPQTTPAPPPLVSDENAGEKGSREANSPEPKTARKRKSTPSTPKSKRRTPTVHVDDDDVDNPPPLVEDSSEDEGAEHHNMQGPREREASGGNCTPLMSEHSGYDVHDDNNYDWDDDADEEPVAPPIFARGMIRSGYDFFKGAPQLRFPSTESESTILERVGVSALTPGMVIPKLKFKTGAVKGFSTILTPTAYYVVGAPGANLTSTLHLGYATTRGDNPLCITFPYQTGEHSILALSDTAIGGEILGPTAMKEITKNGTIALAAPSNPHRQSSRDLGTSQLNRGSDQLAGGRKDMAPLQRALHHNRWKLSMLTNNDPDIKVTNPTLLTRIRNQQANTIIPTLPVMPSDILPKLIQMFWCVTLDFSGTGKKANAVHRSHFLRPDANGDLSTFKCIEYFRDC